MIETEDGTAWALEERLWLEGAPAYEALLHPRCLMAFPGVGILRAAEILASLEAAPRWQSVDMSERAAARAGSALVLAYRAEALRADGDPYLCYCTSTYVAEGGWRLVQHQQSPIEPAA